MKYAQILNGRVFGIFEYENKPEFSEEVLMLPVEDESTVKVGYLFENGEFHQEQKTPEHLGYRITVLAFLNRFRDDEAVAIDLASSGETIQAATVRRYLDKVRVASFIDLKREDLVVGVNSLEGLGLIAEGRSKEILESPVQQHEVPDGNR